MSGLLEFIGETSESFRKIFVEGFIGNVESVGLEMLVYSSKRVADKELDSEPLAYQRIKYARTSECELVLSPMQLKSTYLWLGEKLAEYEAVFGKIPSPQEVQSKLKSYPDSKNSKNQNV